MTTSPMTSFVLSGGGSRGAYEIGVWKALQELDVRFSMVTGTSVGALNAAAIAQGDFELAENLWKELETSNVFDLKLDETLPDSIKTLTAAKQIFQEFLKQGGVDCGRLKKLLEQYLNEDAIRKSPLALGLVTTELPTLKPRYLWKEEIPQGQLIDYLLASCALFPAIQPYEIDGIRYIDGAFNDNMPIKMAIDQGAKQVIAVYMDAPGVVRPYKKFTQMADIRLIQCFWNLGSLLLFDRDHARQNIRLGYLDTMRSYEVYDGYAYAFPKGTVLSAGKQYYSNFAEKMRLFGFRGPNHRLPGLNDLSYNVMKKRISNRISSPVSVQGFVLDGLECSAEIFGLDFCKLYTLPILNERLKEASQQVVLPPALESMNIWQEKGAAAISDALELADRRIRTIYLAKVINDCLAKQRAFNLLPVAALMTDEFCAALYLSFAGIVQ